MSYFLVPLIIEHVTHFSAQQKSFTVTVKGSKSHTGIVLWLVAIFV